jgi:hypothetical protein
MADFNEQVSRAWDEWEGITGQDANNPDDFVVWALTNKKLAPQPQELRRMLRRQVTKALRQIQRTDENGITYRAKQCVGISENGVQMTLWFDTDRGGTPNLRQKALRQRREAIANDVYRAVCDKDHMNSAFPEDPQLNFFTDFTDDCEERRAADLLKREKEDEDDAA